MCVCVCACVRVCVRACARALEWVACDTTMYVACSLGIMQMVLNKLQFFHLRSCRWCLANLELC